MSNGMTSDRKATARRPGGPGGWRGPGWSPPGCRRRSGSGRQSSRRTAREASPGLAGGRTWRSDRQRRRPDLEPDQTLGAKRSSILGQAVEVLAAVALGTLGSTEPPDPLAKLPGLLEDLELGQVGDVGDVFQLEAVAEVGPVAAKPLHRVVVLDSREWKCELLPAELTGHGGDEKLQRGQDVLVLDERHFDVKLGELRLAVGSQVLVAEAAGDLEVTVEAGDHQQLLVELGRLRQ